MNGEMSIRSFETRQNSEELVIATVKAHAVLLKVKGLRNFAPSYHILSGVKVTQISFQARFLLSYTLNFCKKEVSDKKRLDKRHLILAIHTVK